MRDLIMYLQKLSLEVVEFLWMNRLENIEV
jgi:hypothetical protein